MSREDVPAADQPEEELVTFVLPHAGPVRVTPEEAEQLRVGVEIMERWRDVLAALARS